MKARAEALLPGAAPAELDLHLPQPVRAPAAPRGGGGRAARRDFVIYDEDDQLAGRARGPEGARPAGEAPPAAAAPLAHLGAQELGPRPRGRGRRFGGRADLRPRRRALPRRSCDAAQRARLRRPAAAHGGAARAATSRCARPTGGASATCWSTSTRTRTARSTSWSATWRARGATSPWSGDEDQSIYSWRGADIQNILDFEHDFPGARVLRLEENYRSSQAILDAASAPRRPQPAAQGQDAAGGEARRASRCACTRPATSSRRRPGWWAASPRCAARAAAAVLFRMNAQSRLLRRGAACARACPTSVVGGVGFYERKEVKDLLAYLRLVPNPRDPVALRRVLNVPAARHRRRDAGGDRARGRRSASSRSGRRWRAVEDEALLPARATQPLRALPRADRAPARRGRAALAVKDLLQPHPGASRGYSAALAQEDTPGEPGPAGEPGRAALRGRRLRGARARRPAWPASSTRCRCSSDTDQVAGRRAGGADDAALGQGAGVRVASSWSGSRRGSCPTRAA